MLAAVVAGGLAGEPDVVLLAQRILRPDEAQHSIVYIAIVCHLRVAEGAAPTSTRAGRGLALPAQERHAARNTWC